MNNNTLNIETLSECLKSTTHFSGITYQNICDGSSYFLAFGFWEFVGIFSLVFIVLIPCLILIAALIKTILVWYL